MKKICKILTLAVLALMFCAFVASCGTSASRAAVAEITDFSVGYLTEKAYNSGSYAEEDITEDTDFFSATVKYMVVDFKINTLVSNGGDRSIKAEVRMSNAHTLSVTVEETATGKLESVKNEDGSLSQYLLYSVPLNANEKKDVRIILKLIPTNGGYADVSVSVDGGNDTTVKGKTSVSHTFLYSNSSHLAFTLKDDGTYSVSGIGSCTDTQIMIPSMYNGIPVTDIAESAFRGCRDLTSVVINRGVSGIGSSAFFDCSSLTSIVIPDSVTSIGESAFYGCCNLTNVDIPEDVTQIQDKTFFNCSNLVSIQIPKGVRTIGHMAFYNCDMLMNVEIPEGVTSIGNYAFRSCVNLTRIRLPESFTDIGVSAFEECRSLKSIEIPNGVTDILGNTFYYCIALTSVSIPESTTWIGSFAFEGCSSLTSIQFGGTKTQWSAISFGSGWNQNTGEYTVTCTDGTFSK